MLLGIIVLFKLGAARVGLRRGVSTHYVQKWSRGQGRGEPLVEEAEYTDCVKYRSTVGCFLSSKV